MGVLSICSSCVTGFLTKLSMADDNYILQIQIPLECNF